MARIRVLIADDHAVVREGLARVIEDQPDMRVVAQTADGESAIRAGGEHAPQVVLLDMRMPGLSGIATIKRLRQQCPAARVLVLSMYEDPHYVRAARAAGAHGYLSKRSSAATLLAAIRALPDHASFLVRVGDGDPHCVLEPGTDAQAAAVLSAREQEVLQLVAQGHTSREIGQSLGLSKSSIDTYRARLFRKFGVESRSGLMARIATERARRSERRTALDGEDV